MRERLVVAGDREAERGVERELQPVAHERLMQRGVSRSQRERGRSVEDLAELEVLEVRTPDAGSFRPCRAPARQSPSFSF